MNVSLSRPQTAAEYAEREAAHLSSNSLGLEMLLASPYCHDATWTLAKALRLTIDGECIILRMRTV